MMSVITTETDLYESLGLTRELEAAKGNDLKMEDFLELMVTELTNQDPMEPLDNKDLATQISQFATVSGIDELNTSFSGLSESLVSNQALQAANLVGREVLVPSNLGVFTTGSTMDGVIDLDSSAGDVVVRVSNLNGELMKEINLGTQPAGRVNFSWDGSLETGGYADTGYYHVTAQAVVDNETVTPQPLLEAKVNSVNLGGASGQEMQLNLEGLGTISFNDVAEIH
jgi:flagellar basal-body rod modification protein FlgD